MYRGREGQITWRAGGLSTRGGYKGGGKKNPFNRGGTQTGPRRDPNVMDVDKGRGGDRICYVCGKWGHIAKNCWEKHKRRVVETLQKSAKENGEQ